ncbi:MAG: hypothetical protein P8Z37_00130 [Acidobacteriota bacterium]
MESTLNNTVKEAKGISPTMSLNDNLNFLGKELHIQTENVHSGSLCIRTHVFTGGKIIHTTKSTFSSDIPDLSDFDKIRNLMHTQHQKVIDKIVKQQSKYRRQTDF